jgi:hypothetical protein
MPLAGYAVVALVALAFWVQAPPGGVSTLFPRAAILAVLALCGINAILAFVPSGETQSPALGLHAHAPFTRDVAIGIAASLAYVAGVAVVGFYVTTAVFLAVAYNWSPDATHIAWPRSAASFRRLGSRIVGAVVVTAILYLLFTKGLNVQTPHGILI